MRNDIHFEPPSSSFHYSIIYFSSIPEATGSESDFETSFFFQLENLVESRPKRILICSWTWIYSADSHSYINGELFAQCISSLRWHWTSFLCISLSCQLLVIFSPNFINLSNFEVWRKSFSTHLIAFKMWMENLCRESSKFCNWYTSILVKETCWVTKHIRPLLFVSFNHSHVHQTPYKKRFQFNQKSQNYS